MSGSETRRLSETPPQQDDGFHGACHRAGHFGPDPLVQPILRACGDPPTTSQSPRQAAKVEQTRSRHHLEIKHVGAGDLKTDASLRLLDEDIALE